ncbi:MAG TPA: hypothetical protein VE288_06860 [Rubrobacteraceae bacterium]|nr:hypothetical protein [Rubrobacteraceae bacterium]
MCCVIANRRRSDPLADEEVAHVLRRIIGYWRRWYHKIMETGGSEHTTAGRVGTP